MELELVRKHYLEEGYNCAEAILMAMAEERGMALNGDDIKLIGAFGGGMGCGEACGALCASIAMLGRILIREKAHATPELKAECTRYVDKFRETMGGSIDCRDIKPRNTIEGQRCYKTVKDNYELLEETIKKLEEYHD